jgi:hypothetical protein
MGVVYRARERSSGRPVALKVLKGAVSERDLRRFEREAKLPARVRNKGIVEVVDAGVERGVPFIALALVEGLPLSKVTLGLHEHVALLAKVARAIGSAHRAGVIHRDLKPSNVIVEEGSGEPCVVDFGLAFDTRFDASRISMSGEVLGTPAYMAPEVLLGGGSNHDPRIDVYALGFMLYERLNGGHPWKGVPTRELVAKIPHGVPTLPKSCDRQLARLAERALAVDPLKRPADGNELAQELERWLKGEKDEPSPSGARRSLRFFLLGAVFAGLMAAGGFLALVLSRPAPPSSSPPRPTPVAPPAPTLAPLPDPPATPKPVAELMDDSLVAEIDSKVAAALEAHDLEVLAGEFDHYREKFPKDARALHASAMAHLAADPTELPAVRDLARAAANPRALTDYELDHTLLILHELGFGAAAAGIAARALPDSTTRSVELAVVAATVFMTVEPPFTDVPRALKILGNFPHGRVPRLDALRALAQFIEGGDDAQKTAIHEMEKLAESAAKSDEALARALASKIEPYNEQRRWASRSSLKQRIFLFVGLAPTAFLETLHKDEAYIANAYTYQSNLESAADVMAELGKTEADGGHEERAALAFLANARAWQIISIGDEEKADGGHVGKALRLAHDHVAHAHANVRSAVARAYALECMNRDPKHAAELAQESVTLLDAEKESRTPDEVAAGWWVVATVANVDGETDRLKAALDAIKKGLDCEPFDRRPFDALETIIKRRLEKRSAK